MQRSLRAKSVVVLTSLAAGMDATEILEAHPFLSRDDIRLAASEALQLGLVSTDYDQRLAQIKARHHRAYERWTADEEKTVRDLLASGASMPEIALQTERQESAVRSRLTRLGLL